MNSENYSGKYFRTAWGDIKGSKGWFGKICLLGLIGFVPVFGQMTLYGYAYEWAHKAAWGLENPMPKKIYGRDGSKMLRWGWFALVILFVFSLAPSIVSIIGTALSAAGAEDGFYTATGHYMRVSAGNVFYAGLGWIFNVASIVLFVFATLFSWAGTMRMMMYDRLGTGFQFGKIWAMIKQDFGGIMRIFGMALLFGFIGGAIISIIVTGVAIAVIGAAVAPIAIMYSGGMYYDDTLILYILGILVTMLPFFLIMFYIAMVYSSFVDLLVARALGYWTRQFNVAAWGTKDDPLPASTVSHAGDQPQPPHMPGGAQTSAPEAPVASQASAAEAPAAPAAATPAPPTGEPVIEATVPVVAEEVVETVATDVEGEVVVAEVDEVEVTLESEDAPEEK